MTNTHEQQIADFNAKWPTGTEAVYPYDGKWISGTTDLTAFYSGALNSPAVWVDGTNGSRCCYRIKDITPLPRPGEPITREQYEAAKRAGVELAVDKDLNRYAGMQENEPDWARVMIPTWKPGYTYRRALPTPAETGGDTPCAQNQSLTEPTILVAHPSEVSASNAQQTSDPDAAQTTIPIGPVRDIVNVLRLSGRPLVAQQAEREFTKLLSALESTRKELANVRVCFAEASHAAGPTTVHVEALESKLATALQQIESLTRERDELSTVADELEEALQKQNKQVERFIADNCPAELTQVCHAQRRSLDAIRDILAKERA